MRKIKIKAGNVVGIANLNETRTAESIWKALPLEGIGNRWGDEIYFSIPVKLSEENSKEVVDIGDLGYWPPGTAFCIFFGKTPASKKDEVRAASPVNIFGKVIGDATIFKEVPNGVKVVIEKME
jgi:hypothetical protein